MKNRRSLWWLMPVLLLSAFDFSTYNIPVAEIHDGGPPKDGIPALTDPKFVSASKATFLSARDRVLGIEINGDARAYPLSILNWHELVNDRVGSQNVIVTYCPLCGTGMAFSATITGKRFIFGVSGKLYNSDVLFYDQQTESLWSQLLMKAVTGPLTDTKLKQLPLELTRWGAWVKKHPSTTVLSVKTGYKRDYFRNPYVGYEKSETLFFPVSNVDKRLPLKRWVVGVVYGGKAKAYDLKKLARIPSPLRDTLGGKTLRVEYDYLMNSVIIYDESGNVIPSVQAYWFAWAAFHPDTGLYA